MQLPAWLHAWLQRLERPTQLISLESRLDVCRSVTQTIVSIASPTETLRSESSTIVIDIGTPFNWIDDGDAIRGAFGAKFVINLE